MKKENPEDNKIRRKKASPSSKSSGSLTLVIEDLLFKGLKSLNFFVKF